MGGGGAPSESCRECLYVGTATCVGLSAYFTNLAFDGAMQTTKNRAFLLTMAGAWMMAGAYRWHLG